MIGLKSTLGGTGNTLYSTAYHAARHMCAPSAPHRVPSLIQEDEVQWKQPCTAQNHFIPASTSHRSLGTNTDEARLDGANDQDNRQLQPQDLIFVSTQATNSAQLHGLSKIS